MSTWSTTWSPGGFDSWRELYPSTPAFAPVDDITPDFIREWSAAGNSPPAAAGITCIFVRGLFGNWIPKHLAAPLERLRASGCNAIIANTRATGTTAANAAMMRADVDVRAPTGRILFLCHSTGGLDLLTMLSTAPQIAARTAGIALCQAPRGGCAVLESALLGTHPTDFAQRALDAAAAGAIGIAGAREACVELTSPRLQRLAEPLTRVAAELPVISVASWSREPTAWLDSQHARLGSIRPGCAHDGLFYLEDLVWPCGRQVLLPNLDHAQMCVGGGDFDHARFWLVLVKLLTS